MNTGKKTETQRVKQHLIAGKAITARQANQWWDILSMPGLIYELRRTHGLNIITEMCRRRDERGRIKVYGRYRLAKDV